ncbi:winged helix-turn-helix domain-containing protein [Dinoroseobacter sp. S375]|uniref:winged helix-turn-helix domain-containing protein n=1 Tax=Dinoroseobacter sp. S375 TaxID=3415136 RepID=UPI003C7A3D69
MHSLEREIREAPEDQRLEYAIEIVRRLTCEDQAALAHIAKRYGVTPQESRLIWVLASSAPDVAPKERIYTAICGLRGEVEEKLIDVLVSKVRKKTSLTIENVRGFGYALDPEQAKEVLADAPKCPELFPGTLSTPFQRNLPWTPEDDADLAIMVSTGSEVWAMAEEFGRTQRAVLVRIALLRERGALN